MKNIVKKYNLPEDLFSPTMTKNYDDADWLDLFVNYEQNAFLKIKQKKDLRATLVANSYLPNKYELKRREMRLKYAKEAICREKKK